MVNNTAPPGTPDAFPNPQTWIQTWRRVVILTPLPAQIVLAPNPAPWWLLGVLLIHSGFLFGEIGIDVGERKMAKAASAEKEREQKGERGGGHTRGLGGNRALVVVSVSRLTVWREN